MIQFEEIIYDTVNDEYVSQPLLISMYFDGTVYVEPRSYEEIATQFEG